MAILDKLLQGDTVYIVIKSDKLNIEKPAYTMLKVVRNAPGLYSLVVKQNGMKHEDCYNNLKKVELEEYINSIEVINETKEEQLKIELDNPKEIENQTAVEINHSNEKVQTTNISGCEKCGYTGWIVTKPLGLRVKCGCNIESSVNTDRKDKPEKPVYHVNGAQKEQVVEKRLVPESRKDDEYDEETLKSNLIKMCVAQKVKIKGVEDTYIPTLNEIIVELSMGILKQSYIIGAPSGFGKTTFANTCIKRLDAMSKKAAPYISLFELGELRVEHERKMLGYMTNSKKTYDEELGKTVVTYDWSDYINADVLFLHFTTLENKKIECKLLKAVMDIRGPKGLPVVIFIASALKPYLMDEELKKFVWDDILSYNESVKSCSRLVHKSCYKIYNNPMKAKEGRDY